LADFLSALNPAQREAVEHISGPLLILAGAGSGKTRVIAHRIAHVIAGGYALPGEVLAVTFTNKAAEEMRERVERLLGSDCRQIWLSTFHSLCARLLRREAPAIGLSRDFVIYDASDQLAVVKQAMKTQGVDDKQWPARAVLSRISQAKNRMEAPADIRAAGWSPREEQLAKVYESYLRTLSDAGALDFDDLLLKTVELFEQHERIRDGYALKFRQVMVDEYQDTNRPQYMLIKRLAAHHRNLCVVGDPDQSIYKWRGADLRNILDFERDFPDAHVVRLEQNYRSTQVILDAASAVISQNRGRKDKRLWTERNGGAKVLYNRAGDEIEEADFITRTIRQSSGLSAVLYRTNAQSRAIEDALMREGVPYRIIGGVRFYERKEIKDVLAYLRLIINPHDDVSFRRVVNVPARGIGKSVIDALEAVDVEQEAAGLPLLANAGLQPVAAPRSMWSRLVVAIERRLLAPRALAALQVFRDLILSLAEEEARGGVSTVIGLTLER
jgi:DNA helicase-2/ATP-dependent DNA helicase PcrA